MKKKKVQMGKKELEEKKNQNENKNFTIKIYIR